MKRYLLFIIIFGATLLWSATSHALGDGTLGFGGGANDNPHNLSSQSSTPGGETDIKSTNSTEICVFCHTPHGATPNSTLWGRPDPDTTSFPTFTQGTLGIADASMLTRSEYGQGEYPNGASKLCLSCHDGITALGVTVRGVDLLVPGSIGGINLATSHPISFKYNDLANYLTDLNTLRGSTYSLPDEAIVPLDWDKRVQCTICHEPHFDTKDGTYTLPFWRAAQKTDQTADYNRICDQCHTTDYYPGIDHTIP